MEDYEVDDQFVRETGQFDLTLIVEKHKIHVSKAVLCIASPVFRAMLESNFKEKEQIEVCLPEKKYADVVNFLGCFYPDHLEIVTRDNVYGILPLAVEYQVKILEKRCQSCLIHLVKSDHLSDIVEIYHHIQLSETYNLTGLHRVCTYIASEFSLKEIEQAAATYPITDRSLIQIHHTARMREELNKMDDKILEEKMIGKNGTYKAVIRNHIENSFSSFLFSGRKDHLTLVRLWHRYFQEDKQLGFKVIDDMRCIMTETRALNDDDNDLFPKQELDLLPEMVKQMLHLE